MRATYLDAPDGGVVVHQDCLGQFYKNLEDEQWKRDMEEAYRAELASIHAADHG